MVSVLDSLLEWEGCILKMLSGKQQSPCTIFKNLCKFKISPPHTKLGNIDEAKEFTVPMRIIDILSIQILTLPHYSPYRD